MRSTNLRTPSILLSLCLLVGLVSCENNPQNTRTDQPNVILILTDDQGTLDLNCYGAKDLTTPNLDKLAQTGVRFTNFYVGSSICSPSRAALLTGRSPQGAGLAVNANSIRLNGMPSSSITLAEMLRDAGYKTGLVGKWHLGFDEGSLPAGQGFEYSFGFINGCIDNYSHFYNWNGPVRHDLWENGVEVFRDGEYFPDLMSDKAREFIKLNKENPFFLFYSINTPHYPMQPPQKWRDHYQDLPMPRRDYAAFVSTTDEKVGELINVLEEEDLSENTIVIFLSDHGHSSELRSFSGGGYAGPNRGSKKSLFEGGIKVPAIINWKGKLKAQVEEQICMSMDLLPTIAQLCGIEELPAGVEGNDFSAVIISNESSKHTLMYWQLKEQWAVRKGDWKLVVNPVDENDPGSIDLEKDHIFLINLKEDPSERHNLASEYPEKVDELIEEYIKWPYAIKEDIPIRD